MNRYQVEIAAEAYAAALLARAGCDVSVQYGANQPEYDLITVKGEKFLKISVKGSQDGSWIAAGSYKKRGVTYAEALNQWKNKHKPKTIFIFVQFKNSRFGEMPRMYMANVKEVAKFLSSTSGGHINLILYEKYKYILGVGAGHEDIIPKSWKLSEKRIDDMFRKYG